MKCPSCGFESPAGFRFCGACGTAFGAAAPAGGGQAAPPTAPPSATDAGAALPAAPPPVAGESRRGDRGATPETADGGAPRAAWDGIDRRGSPSGAPRPLPPAEPPAPARSDERRTVTILFADISGFTAMSEKLDPETVQEVMDRAFERLTAVITGFGGTIDKYIGDAIMALFGAPVALGDDPERAVRAGLAMQKVMSDYSQELTRTRGIPLAMRVGINTGKVIWGRVGGAGEKSFTVMGDAVNLASRLEHAAPIGGVLIGESTQRHVRSRFSLEALEPIQVKGKAEPQRVYRVLGELGVPARATMLGPRSPFVGRDEEMGEFLPLLREVRNGGTGRVTTLDAPAGSGKSRLVLELRAEADDLELPTLSARAAPFGQGAPYSPWTDLIARGAGLGGLPAGTARERLREWLQGTAGSPEVDPRWFDELANVVDPSDPEIQRRREQPAQFRKGLAEALVAWLRAYAGRRGLLFIAEDLHWWPAPALDLLVRAAEVARAGPILLVATRRPEPVAVPWPPDAADRVWNLGPLDGAALHALAHGVLGGEPPSALIRRLQSTSGGNPFFAEELVQAFIDTGALSPRGDRKGWTWDEAKAERAQLPTTVEGVTQARIDALPARERRVLQMAAVAGRTFWLGLLKAMGEPLAHEAVQQLVGRDLIHGRRSRLAGETEYTFKHPIIQSVAYENALKRERLNDHRRVAEWLEARAGEAATEFAPIIAEHYQRADLKPKALPFLLRAATDAAIAFARLEEATAVEEAVRVAEEVRDDGALGQALGLRGRLRRRASHPDAESDLRRAIEIAERREDAMLLAEAGMDLTGVVYYRGDLAEAEALARKTEEAAKRAGSARIQAISLNVLGSIAQARGELDAAIAFKSNALRRAEEASIDRVIGLVLISLGWVHLAAGRFQDCIAVCERALQMSVGSENEVHLRSNLGASLLGLDQLDRALSELSGGLEKSERIGSRMMTAELLVRRGEVRIRLGEKSAGYEEIDRGIALAREIDAAEPLIEGLCRKAEVLMGENRIAAKDAALEARSLSARRGLRQFLVRADELLQRLG